jgi:hypothetical protein
MLRGRGPGWAVLSSGPADAGGTILMGGIIIVRTGQ